MSFLPLLALGMRTGAYSLARAVHHQDAHEYLNSCALHREATLAISAWLVLEGPSARSLAVALHARTRVGVASSK